MLLLFTAVAADTYSGSAAVTLGPPAATATGALAVSGSAACALVVPAAAATGALQFIGTADVSLGGGSSAVCEATGVFTADGTADVSLAAPVCSATGTFQESTNYTGSAAVSLNVAVCDATGSFVGSTYIGTCTASLAAPVMWSFQAEYAKYIEHVKFEQRELIVGAEERRLFVKQEARSLPV